MTKTGTRQGGTHTQTRGDGHMDTHTDTEGDMGDTDMDMGRRHTDTEGAGDT